MLGAIQYFHSQESNGIVALALPVRNSLKFNRYALSPTFSFVREQNKYISFTNKKQWAQFDGAPNTYLFSYSGRFAENIGAGIGLFQQDIGVLTTFGGILNFAYNANFSEDNNLTFGLNTGLYQSGINQGKIVTNTPDTSLDNIPSNLVLSINPGINYGMAFMDIGLSINNLITYNLNTSELIEDNPEQALQAHVMYTGYVNSVGFFDEAKFSTLLRSEFKSEQTILSGIAMITVPKGIWAQAGYNTLFGASAGIGFNVTKNIAVEYNYEQSLGDLSEFGSAHEITVAYRFDNKYRFRYGDDDQQQSVFNSNRRKTKASSISAEERAKVAERRAAIIAQRKAIAENKANTNESIESAEIKPENTKKIVNTDTRTENVAGVENTSKSTDTILPNVKEDEKAKLKLAEEKKAAAEKQRKLEAAKRQAKIDEENRKRQLELEAKVKAEAEEKRRQLEEQQRKLEEAAAKKDIKAEQKDKGEAVEEVFKKADANIQKDVSLDQNTKDETSSNSNSNLNQNQENSEGETIPEAEDEESKTLKALTQSTNKIINEQRDLLNDLSESVALKQKDLNDLTEENDLSEKGIYRAPKKFKSVTAENAKIEAIKDEIEKIEQEQEAQMIELEALLITRKRKYRKDRQGINDFYKNTIAQIKQEQLRIKNYKLALIANLEKIKVATDFERKRRISRAAYDNQEDRYKKDQAALTRIKANTQESDVPLTEDDFDFGEETSSNIQIVNNIVNEEPGYYLVIAVHDDVKKRDEFVAKVVASGEKNINFFFDVETNRYYIYYEKFSQINAAKNAMNNKESKPYNAKMSLVKIED